MTTPRPLLVRTTCAASLRTSRPLATPASAPRVPSSPPPRARRSTEWQSPPMRVSPGPSPTLDSTPLCTWLATAPSPRPPPGTSPQGPGPTMTPKHWPSTPRRSTDSPPESPCPTTRTPPRGQTFPSWRAERTPRSRTAVERSRAIPERSRRPKMGAPPGPRCSTQTAACTSTRSAALTCCPAWPWPRTARGPSQWPPPTEAPAGPPCSPPPPAPR
mmetsp:Transcript_61019/g.125820  ORF Transcript_61019/g.125820 Transcript_61019/m.125820 type:complete len:216 (+) Transcript_61019:244-891(+)